jgi:hypothetical protein
MRERVSEDKIPEPEKDEKKVQQLVQQSRRFKL